MNPRLPRHRRNAGTRSERRRHQPLLLRHAPAPATLHRGDDFDRALVHATIPMNSHMTHTLTGSTRRPSPDAYGQTAGLLRFHSSLDGKRMTARWVPVIAVSNVSSFIQTQG